MYALTDDLPELRTKHPFVMYDMLKDIPAGIRATINIAESQDLPLDKPPYYFTGNGTAFHSAIAGAQSISNHDDRIKFVQAYELEKFWKPSGTIIAYSHTGKTKSTVDAVRRHRGLNMTIGVSHFPHSPLLENTLHQVVIGNSPDASLCNTKAFFDNAFHAMYLASRIMSRNVDMRAISGAIISAGDGMDQSARSLADKLRDIGSIYVLGAGPDIVFARETAQKLREATHLRSEGIELEEFNHGCTAVMDEGTLLIIANNRTVNGRVSDIVRASREVGSRTLVLNGDGDYSFNFETFNDGITDTLLNVLAIYYFAYHLAVKIGVNPDLLRFEDSRYRRYDDVIFPPGAH